MGSMHINSPNKDGQVQSQIVPFLQYSTSQESVRTKSTAWSENSFLHYLVEPSKVRKLELELASIGSTRLKRRSVIQLRKKKLRDNINPVDREMRNQLMWPVVSERSLRMYEAQFPTEVVKCTCTSKGALLKGAGATIGNSAYFYDKHQFPRYSV